MFLNSHPLYSRMRWASYMTQKCFLLRESLFAPGYEQAQGSYSAICTRTAQSSISTAQSHSNSTAWSIISISTARARAAQPRVAAQHRATGAGQTRVAAAQPRAAAAQPRATEARSRVAAQLRGRAAHPEPQHHIQSHRSTVQSSSTA